MENEPKPEPNQTTEPAESTGATPPAINKSNDHTLGMACHLLALSGLIGVPFGNILGPLIMWLVKREEVPFVDACGKEAVNFQISMTIYGTALVVISFPIMIIPFLGFLIFGAAMLAIVALVIVGIVFTVIASIKASEGTVYEYPLTIRFIK